MKLGLKHIFKFQYHIYRPLSSINLNRARFEDFFIAAVLPPILHFKVLSYLETVNYVMTIFRIIVLRLPSCINLVFDIFGKISV